MTYPDTDYSGRFAPHAQGAFGVLVHRLAYGLAMAGGCVLVAITLMTVTSISTFSQFFGWFPELADFFKTIEGGYYELVQAGTAFAVFCFLPWCQLQRGHVTVDIFVMRMGPKVMSFLALIGNIILTIAAGVIAWRMWLGLLDKQAYSETTFILQFPVWWGYVSTLVGAVLFTVVGFYTVWRSLNEVTGLGERSASPMVH